MEKFPIEADYNPSRKESAIKIVEEGVISHMDQRKLKDLDSKYLRGHLRCRVAMLRGNHALRLMTINDMVRDYNSDRFLFMYCTAKEESVELSPKSVFNILDAAYLEQVENAWKLTGGRIKHPSDEWWYFFVAKELQVALEMDELSEMIKKSRGLERTWWILVKDWLGL